MNVAMNVRASHLRLIGILLVLVAVLALHLVGGSLALSAGIVQIWLGLTNRVGVTHRLLGKVYGAGVLLGSSTANGCCAVTR